MTRPTTTPFDADPQDQQEQGVCDDLFLRTLAQLEAAADQAEPNSSTDHSAAPIQSQEGEETSTSNKSKAPRRMTRLEVLLNSLAAGYNLYRHADSARKSASVPDLLAYLSSATPDGVLARRRLAKGVGAVIRLLSPLIKE